MLLVNIFIFQTGICVTNPFYLLTVLRLMWYNIIAYFGLSAVRRKLF